MVQPNKASAAPSQVTQNCLLCRSYADELSPLTDASIRDNATMLLKELKTKGCCCCLYSIVSFVSVCYN